MDVNAKIDKLRKERGWTKSKLAKQAGITPTTVYNWFNAVHSTPNRDSIENVCLALGVSVASFYADIDFQDPTEQEIELLEVFRLLSDEKKQAALSLLKVLTK